MDIEIARRFVAALTGSADTPLRLRFIHDKDRERLAAERYGSILTYQSEIDAFQRDGFGVYYVLNQTTATVPGDAAADSDVTKVRAIPADFDHGIPNVADFHLPPSLVVHTSAGKGQALWLTDVPLDEFRPLCERVIAAYGSDKTVKNLSRVLRLPGTYHLKGKPQLVTFEGSGKSYSDVSENLPTLPERKASSEAAGDPVPWPHLVELLKHIDPDMEYPDWRDTVAAIHNTNCGDEEKREALALAWSSGELHGKAPSKWTGPEAVGAVWETMPPREGGVGYGTLFHLAGKGGFIGRAIEVKPGSELVRQYLNLPGQWHLVRDMRKRTPPPLEEIIPGLVEKGIVTFLSGPGGSMKSRLAIQWGLSVDMGLPIWGRTVMRSEFIYLSYEDSYNELLRRFNQTAAKLGIPQDDHTARVCDMVGLTEPLAIIGDDVILTSQYVRFLDTLKAIPGHKFVVIDSTYNALRFTGNAKVNEASVQMGIGVLSQLCEDGDATIVSLWHPSQAGQTRGDGSGWSVAWHNTPRARLSIEALKDHDGVFQVKVEKRNHAARPKDPIVLHWTDGVLLPVAAVEGAEARSRFATSLMGIVQVCAEKDIPIQMQKKLPTWVFDEIELLTGKRPTEREIKQELENLQREGRIRYRNHSRGEPAGFIPIDKPTSTSDTGEVEGAQ